MSLKYEGEIGDRDGSWCYAFKFIRLRKEWIREDKKDKRTCGTTVSPVVQLVCILMYPILFNPCLILVAYVPYYTG